MARRMEELDLKRGWIGLLALLLLAVPARAEETARFEWEQDFDGDGQMERFVVEGEDNGVYVSGDLIYLDGEERQVVAADQGWLPGECAAWQMEDGWLFKAEEGYGIGGTSSCVYCWTEEGLSATNGVFMGLTRLNDTDFSFALIDTDRLEDGTGRTYKRYYVHWTQGNFVEYGGLRINREDVAALPGGAEVLQAIKDAGNSIKSVYYRENGLVNITYCDGMVNGNATLRLEDGALTLLDVEGNPTDDLERSDFGGMYMEMSGRTRYVTYPTAFPPKEE